MVDDLYAWSSLVVLALAQAVLWSFLYDKNGPLVKPAKDWATRKQKVGNILANLRPVYARLGITEEEAVFDFWGSNLGILVHHTLGTIFAFVAWLSGMPWLMCIGLSFEIGEDILHFWQALTNTGIFEKPQPKIVYVLLAFHHTLGLVAGSISYVYLSHWPDVQLLVALLLSAALPACILTPLQAFADLSQPGGLGILELCINVSSLIFMLYSRFYVFIPLTYSLTKRVIAQVSPTIGYILMFPLSLFGLFNIFSVLLSLATIVTSIKNQGQKKKTDVDVGDALLTRSSTKTLVSETSEVLPRLLHRSSRETMACRKQCGEYDARPKPFISLEYAADL